MSCTRNVVLQVGDFMFVHAGVLPEHINSTNKTTFIKKINSLMRLYLQGKKTWQDKASGKCPWQIILLSAAKSWKMYASTHFPPLMHFCYSLNVQAPRGVNDKQAPCRPVPEAG